jgi:hypothetical protein
LPTWNAINSNLEIETNYRAHVLGCKLSDARQLYYRYINIKRERGRGRGWGLREKREGERERGDRGNGSIDDGYTWKLFSFPEKMALLD